MEVVFGEMVVLIIDGSLYRKISIEACSFIQEVLADLA